MKTLLLSFAVIVAFVLVITPQNAVSYPTGAPNDFGGPDNYCTACHFDFDLDSGTGSVEITAQSTFMLDEEITITVTVDNTTPPDPEPKQGFMISARDADDSAVHVGLFDPGDSGLVQIGQNGTMEDNLKYITHTEAGSNETSWTFTWTAPSDSPPDAVTFYAAGNAANGNSTFTGDYIYSTSKTLTYSSVGVEQSEVPTILSLDTVYPNPFRSIAEVEYTLAESAPVTIYLRDALGRTVRVLENGTRAPGTHHLAIDADDLASGLYFLTIQTATGSRTRTITIAR